MLAVVVLGLILAGRDVNRNVAGQDVNRNVRDVKRNAEGMWQVVAEKQNGTIVVLKNGEIHTYRPDGTIPIRYRHTKDGLEVHLEDNKIPSVTPDNLPPYVMRMQLIGDNRATWLTTADSRHPNNWLYSHFTRLGLAGGVMERIP
jgi:hypothetical protein